MRLLLGVLIGIALGAATGWPLGVAAHFPAKAKPAIGALIDEAGNVLLGSTPAQVEIANIGTPLQVQVTSLPSSGGGGGSAGQLVPLLTGVAVPCGGPRVASMTIPTGNARQVAVLGGTQPSAGTPYVTCAFGTSQGFTLDDGSPTAVFFDANGYAINNLLSGDQKPVLGPYLRCFVTFSGCVGAETVNLSAWLVS